MGLPPIEMDLWWSWCVSCMISSRNKLNGMGESKRPDGHLLLSWRTPVADCSRGLHFWISHIVPEWLEPVLPLCWSFWGPATGLHARLCQTPSWSLWSCGTDHADIVGASLRCFDFWRLDQVKSSKRNQHGPGNRHSRYSRTPVKSPPQK